MIVDNFSGQSITLIKENKDYFILRKYFGSGVSLIRSVKYKVTFNSKYQIAFSETAEVNPTVKDKKEDFLLSVEEHGLCLYLNRLKVAINENGQNK